MTRRDVREGSWVGSRLGGFGVKGPRPLAAARGGKAGGAGGWENLLRPACAGGRVRGIYIYI